MNTALLLKLAALTYFGLLVAGLLMPRVVGLPEHTRALPKFIRQLIWVYYTFIALCLIGFGLGTFFFANELASGAPLARAVCGFLAVFWTVRLAAAIFLFDVRPYLRNRFLRLGYLGLNCVFVYLVILYAFVAWRGGLL